ncbi:MAG: hypothetical protein Q4F43_03630 [Eubacteriales bacterium]|nr:hypothetical protein [Eubacteriales bacterium]
MKVKRTGRRVAALLLTCIMVLSLAACGGSGSSQQGGGGTSSGDTAAMPQVTIRDGVARGQQVVVTDPEFSSDGLQLLGMEDGWFYGLYYNYSDDTNEESYELVRFQSDGSGLEHIQIQGKDAGTEIAAATFLDGCYYLGMVTYHNSEALDYALEHEGTTGEVAIPEGLSEDASGSYELACVTPDGTMKWSKPIDEAFADEYYFIGSLDVTEDGIYVVAADRVDLFSRKDGSFVNTVCAAKEDDLTGSLYVLKDGTVIMTDDFSAAMKIRVYDPGKKAFTENASFPSAVQGAQLFPGLSHDFYLASDDGVYGGSLGSGELTPVINFVNSDLDAQGVVKLIETPEGQYVIQVYGSDTSLQIYVLDPVAPEDVQEKTELTLGGYYIDFEIRSEVIRFNKESDKYRISLVDYSQYDLEDDEYYDSTGFTKMNSDIISGTAPDIMLLTEGVPVDNFISKGVFEDLTDRYNGDEGIDKSDFLTNITDSFLTDGRMYVAVPGFMVTGVSGKQKYIGDGKDLSIDSIRKIAAGRGLKDSDIFGVIDRDTVFQSAVMFSGDQFIDRDAHTCDFNNAQFQELLEFARLFPEEISEEQYNDYFTQYLADKALLNIQYINTVYDYNYMTRDLFGDLNVTLTGFPSADNKGAAVSAAMQLGINSSASDPDGCWSFIRRLYMPDFQMKMEGCLPVSEKAIDTQGQELIKSLREQREEYEAYLQEGNTPDSAAGTDTASDAAADAAVGTTAKEATAEGTTAEGAGAAEETSGSGETAATAAAAEEISEDLIGIPLSEEEFQGTHEEYEAYLKEFKEELAANGGTVEVVVIGEEAQSDENGEFVGAAASNLPDFNEEDLASFKEILKSLDYSVNEDSDIWAIISEEAAAYFAGQKSAEEVTDIIQSRVQVYLKENE